MYRGYAYHPQHGYSEYTAEAGSVHAPGDRLHSIECQGSRVVFGQPAEQHIGAPVMTASQNVEQLVMTAMFLQPTPFSFFVALHALEIVDNDSRFSVCFPLPCDQDSVPVILDRNRASVHTRVGHVSVPTKGIITRGDVFHLDAGRLAQKGRLDALVTELLRFVPIIMGSDS